MHVCRDITVELTCCKLSSKNSLSDSIPFNGHCICKAVLASIEVIFLGGGAVSGVVVTDPVGHATSTNHYNVCAVHRMK